MLYNNSNIGIYIYLSYFNRINNSFFKCQTCGIYLSYSQNNTILNNYFYGAGDNINLRNSY